MSVLTGDAHRLGRDAVAGQELALALGGRAAVAPHRGDDERLVAHLPQGVDGRPGDHRDAADPAAADPDGDRAARGNPLAQPAGADQAGGPSPARLRPEAGESIGERGPAAEGSCEVNLGLPLRN